NSPNYKALQVEIEEYKTQHPLNGPDAEAFRAHKHAQQAKGQRVKSPFTLSFMQQVQLCLWRGWQRLIGDPSITVGSLIGNTVMALIIGSVFYNLQDTSASFFQRGALLFFALLMNAFASALEILTLYAQRPIVEKHSRYALYHPSAEAVASMLVDMPYKLLNCLVFNITLYFITNLRREAGAFFFFLLISFFTVLAMSMIFRTIASSSRTLSQAMVPAAILILILVIFTGFVIPTPYMLDWCRWLNYVDPLAYAFEALVVNEFHNRNFICTNYVPSTDPAAGYESVSNDNRVCTAVGSIPGNDFVNGDAYASLSFGYEWANRWRNFGILIAFMLGFLVIYMVAAEFVSEKKSKGEVLVFRRGYKPSAFNEKHAQDDPEDMVRVGPVTTAERARVAEKGQDAGFIQRQTSIFHWNNVCYEVKIKKETRRILDNVDGWVKPGTLTALMGGMVHQVGDNRDYMPLNHTASLGNDDQGFWGMTAMLAAENKFPDPPEDQPQWLALAQAVWSTQNDRFDDHCNGGLRWQAVSTNAGYNYKNTIANGCFFNIGARLARYTRNDTYTQAAEETWDWLWGVNYIDHENWRVYDGGHIEHNCTDINKATFSYNIAVLMQGAAFMYNYTEDAKWLDRVEKLLDRCLTDFFPRGV
ncbi:hypothetical protein BN1708_017329, partial [Verticillium longisporum]